MREPDPTRASCQTAFEIEVYSSTTFPLLVSTAHLLPIDSPNPLILFKMVNSILRNGGIVCSLSKVAQRESAH